MPGDENQENQAGGLSVRGVEIHAVFGDTEGEEGPLQNVDAGVGNGHTVSHACGDDLFPLPDGLACSFIVKISPLAGDCTELPDGLLRVQRFKVFHEDFGCEKIGDAERFLTAEDLLYGRSACHGCQYGHDDQGHEHAFTDDPRLKGEEAEDNLHGASGVHAETDGPCLSTRQSAPDRPEPAAEDLSCRGDHKNGEDKGEIEVLNEIDFQPDAGKKERCEDEGDELIERGTRVFPQMGRVSQGHTAEEGAEDCVDADPFGIGGAQEGNRDAKAQDAAGPSCVRLDPGENAVDQPSPDSQHQGDKAQGQPDRLPQAGS